MSYKVVNAMKTGSYESQWGEEENGKKVMHKWAVMFEGETEPVTVSQKPTQPLKPGDTLDGTIKDDPKWGRQFEKTKAGGYQGGNRTDSPEQRASIEKQVCYKLAAEVVRDYITVGPEDQTSDLTKSMDAYRVAVMTTAKVFMASMQNANPQTTVTQPTPVAETDDMPPVESYDNQPTF